MSKKYANQFLCSRMMLPEHRTKLARYRQEIEQAEQYRRLLLDQQQWEQFQVLLECSYFGGVPVRVTILEENGYRTVTGVVQKLLPVPGAMELSGANGRQRVLLRRVVAMIEVPADEDSPVRIALRQPVDQSE